MVAELPSLVILFFITIVKNLLLWVQFREIKIISYKPKTVYMDVSATELG